MNNETPDIRHLFEKYTKGIAEPDEVKRLFALIGSNAYDPEMRQLLLGELEDTETPETDNAELEASLMRVKRQIKWLEGADEEKPRRSFPIRYIAAAASVLLLVSFGLLFYYLNGPKADLYANDVLPGGNKAVLTLADGRTIDLSTEQSGIIVGEGITYLDGTEILDDRQQTTDNRQAAGKESLGSSVSRLLSLTTPKGGQYQVRLPDGTKAWLNAASSLTYPASFASQQERRVHLTGEAYFEVASDKTVPFRVETPNQLVEVVGTHFNVNSYADEPGEKTTLVEGIVKVSKGGHTETLNPGQEATVADGITVTDADIRATLSWQGGKFIFNDESLESIMRKISRWYNVEVVYDGVDRAEQFGGSFSRYDNVSKVLRKLELTGGIHFKIEGRRITVMN